MQVGSWASGCDFGLLDSDLEWLAAQFDERSRDSMVSEVSAAAADVEERGRQVNAGHLAAVRAVRIQQGR